LTPASSASTIKMGQWLSCTAPIGGAQALGLTTVGPPLTLTLPLRSPAPDPPGNHTNPNP